MIWLLMGVLVLAALLFVTKPLYAKSAPHAVQDSEVTDYVDQIADIDQRLGQEGANEQALTLAKTELQRQLLASKAKPLSVDDGPPAILLASLFVIMGFGALGLYSMLGRPELSTKGALQKPVMSTSQAAAQNADPKHENNQSLTELVARLETRLSQDENNPEGWILLARSLMNLNRYSEAVTAYKKVIKLTDNNPNVIAEFKSAKTYIEQQSGKIPNEAAPGPTQDDIKAAASMSAQDRTAMIEGMVERLAQKLADNPNDKQGWVRLLNARRVLKQNDIAQSDIARMKAVFKNNPETISEILAASGWGKK